MGEPYWKLVGRRLEVPNTLNSPTREECLYSAQLLNATAHPFIHVGKKKNLFVTICA